MKLLKQIFEIAWMNLRNIPQRLGTSLVIVVGIAGVVGVLVALLAMAEGFRATLAGTGKDDRAIVMREGANAELSSGLSREQVDLIKRAAGVKRNAAGEPIASGELLVIADLPKASTGTLANAQVRGVQPEAFELRPEVKIIEGRNFTPGPRELIAGRGAASQFADIKVGSQIAFRDSAWTVVGLFEAGGGSHESEFWGDAEVVQSAYRRNGFQSVSAQLESPAALATFRTALSDDPRLTVKVQSQKDYYESQSRQLSTVINIIGTVIAAIMAIGAVFGALNTMYAAIATRSREIATLRAIGFGGLPVVVSVMIEALLLALIGGVLGALLAYVIFNGYTVSTLNGASFSQVAFDFRVTPELMKRGLTWALLIGLIGGLLPAIRAARLPVTTALRAL
jgi:putative ABC transport system permease protein